MKPIAQLPQGLSLNNVVPTVGPGSSILAAAAAHANIPTALTTPTDTPGSGHTGVPPTQQSPTAQAQQKTPLPSISKFIASSAATNVRSPPQHATWVAGSTVGAHQIASKAGMTSTTVVGSTSMAAQPAAPPTNLAAGVKPVTQIPIQFIPAAAAQMATLQQLVNQAAAANLPRVSAPSVATQPAAGATAAPSSTAQMPSAINMAPMPLILSPSMLAPSSIGQTPQLTQVTTANIVSAPMLKNLTQIPVQQLALSGAGLKPVVMVTMPSVVSPASSVPVSSCSVAQPTPASDSK